MTTIVGGATGSTNIFDSDSLLDLASSTLGTHSSTSFTMSNSDFTLTGQGTGITYSSGHPSGGTLTGVTLSVFGYTGTWSGFSISVSTLWHAIATGDTATFQSLFFSGNDTFTSGVTNPHTVGDNMAGYGGDDTFNMGAGLGVFSHIDGGDGNDTVNLNGDYSNNTNDPSNDTILFPSSLVSVEKIVLTAGHSYALTFWNGNVGVGKTMTIDGSGLHSGDYLHFNGSAETDGSYILKGGAGDDYLRGGANSDTFIGGGGSDTVDYSGTSGVTIDLTLNTPQAISGQGADTLQGIENIVGSSGNDTFTGNSSDNTFNVGGGGHDVIDGGAGNDTVSFDREFYVTVNLSLSGPQTVDQQGDTVSLTSVENIIGSAGNDVLVGNSSDNIINGGDGNDIVRLTDATSGVTIDFTGASVSLSGGGVGHDTYISVEQLAGSNFDDTIIASATQNTYFDGGAGSDTVSYAHATNAVSLNLTTGQEMGLTNGSPDASLPSGGFGNVENAIGSQFDDQLTSSSALGSFGSLDGGAGNDSLTTYVGTETLQGGTGDDTITIHDFVAGDKIDGGAGNDFVFLSPDPTQDVPIVFAADTMINVETLSLDTFDSKDLTTNDATVAAGQTMTIEYGTDLNTSVGNQFRFDGSAETNGNFNVISTAYYNTIILGAGNDTYTSTQGAFNSVDISHGGNDTVMLGQNTDTVYAGGALNAADKIEDSLASAIVPDTLILDGDYSAGVVFTPTTVVNFELFTLMAGHSYKLTTNDATVAAGQTLTVDASTLGSGNSLTFNGAAETDGNFVLKGGAGNDVLTAGAGNDTLTGGAGADTFQFTATGLTSADTVNGGNDAALDRIVFTTAGTIAADAFTNVSHIEQIVLADGTNSLTVSNGLVNTADDNFQLSITGGSGNDTIDGSGVTTTSNQLSITAHGGNDTLTGGAGADTFKFDATDLTSGDQVNGGTGASLDRLTFTSAGTVATDAFANVTHIEQIALANGTNSVTLSNGLVSSADDGHLVVVTGNAGNDTIDASQVSTASNYVWMYAYGGNDTLMGGASTDTFLFNTTDLTAADTVNGGTGTALDRLTFTSAGTVAASAFANVSHIEQIALANGFNTVTLTDALVTSADDNHTLTIIGGSGNDTVDGSQVTTGSNQLTFVAHGGNDSLTGGAGADTFQFDGTELTSSDTVNGGTGAGLDRLALASPASLNTDAFTNVSHIEQITLSGGTNVVRLSNGLVSSADDNQLLAIACSTGNDGIDASAVTTSTARVWIYAGTGQDNLTGGAGADNFLFASANFNSLDSVNGGTGASLDRLTFTTAGTIAADAFGPPGSPSVTHIEQIALANGTNSLTLTDALVGSADDNHLLTVTGNDGNDAIDATGVTTAANQVSFVAHGGNDTLLGGAGADTFLFDANALTSADTVNGGTGSSLDRLTFTLAGTIGSSAFTNVYHIEQITLASGNNTVALTDALVGSADDNHLLAVTGSDGNDTIDASQVTTSTNHVWFYAYGGNDTLTGGAGDDNFLFTALNLTSGDTVNGGSGSSTDKLTFTTVGTVGTSAFTHVSHIEQIALANGTNSVTLTDALVGSADDNHLLTVTGGSGADTIDASQVTTAANAVRFIGGGGADVLTAGAGADIFAYTAASDSTSTTYDTISGLNFSADRFDIPGGSGTITAIDAALTAGTLDSGSNFDTELASAEAGLGAHHAQLFTANAGSLSGQTFLVVDLNGIAGYQAGSDLVIHLVGATGTLATGDFV